MLSTPGWWEGGVTSKFCCYWVANSNFTEGLLFPTLVTMVDSNRKAKTPYLQIALHVVSILLIFYFLMGPNCLVSLCKAPFMDKSQLVFPGSLALFPVGSSLSWVTQGERGSTEEALPHGQVGVSKGGVLACFLSAWLFYTLQFGWLIHTVFLFSILGLNSTSQGALSPENWAELNTGRLWILGSQGFGGCREVSYFQNHFPHLMDISFIPLGLDLYFRHTVNYLSHFIVFIPMCWGLGKGLKKIMEGDPWRVWATCREGRGWT